MRLTYDPAADAAYVYLTDRPARGAVTTYNCDPRAVGGMINLDFDATGALLGIEIMDASRFLPASLLSPGDPGSSRSDG